jgi:serine phosphatase RsbU (regulator of sigma subunit)
VELALACELGRRAGTAVENARMYAERTHIAHELQSTLLPEKLLQPPGTEVRALYAAAGELNEVGGDFYDVFERDGGRWMLSIGDVCGKGPRAAGVTALARHTLRAAALSGQSPAEMLRTLHRALALQPVGEDMCTACLVMLELEPSGGARVSVTLAGHPPALVIASDGSVSRLGKQGTMLGVIDPIAIEEVHAELPRGATLLLHTDGVSDAGRPGRTVGEEELMRLCAGAAGQTVTQLLHRIELAARTRAEGSLRDDIALLALRLGSSGVADSGGGDAEPHQA